MAKKIPDEIKARFPKGYRVQLHPGTDAWMMGARYGEIRGYVNSANDGPLIRVKLDKMRKVKEFHPRNLAEVFAKNPKPLHHRAHYAGGVLAQENDRAYLRYDYSTHSSSGKLELKKGEQVFITMIPTDAKDDATVYVQAINRPEIHPVPVGLRALIPLLGKKGWPKVKKNSRRRNPVENKTHALKAITVKHGRGSWVIARDSDNNNARTAYDFGLDAYGNAIKAAEKLQDKMGWGGTLVGGYAKDGYVFVFREFKARLSEAQLKRMGAEVAAEYIQKYGKPTKNPALRGGVKANPRTYSRWPKVGKAKLGKWEVTILENGRRGYFEHDVHGEGGGLWFTGMELTDQDGTYVLPLNVARVLRDHFKVIVPSSYLNDDEAWKKETPGVPEFPGKKNPRKRGKRRKSKRAKKNPDAFVIALYMHGKRLTYNANKNRFTDEGKPALYRTQIAAKERAESLLKSHANIRAHKITIETATRAESGAVFGARPRQNPKLRKGMRVALNVDSRVQVYKRGGGGESRGVYFAGKEGIVKATGPKLTTVLFDGDELGTVLSTKKFSPIPTRPKR